MLSCGILCKVEYYKEVNDMRFGSWLVWIGVILWLLVPACGTSVLDTDGTTETSSEQESTSGTDDTTEVPSSDATTTTDTTPTDTTTTDTTTQESGPETSAPDGALVKDGKYKITVDPRGHAASALLPKEEFDLWNERKGFQVTTVRKAFTKEIYKAFKDEFDFVFFVLNNKVRPNVLPFGQLVQVSNSVKGIGSTVYSRASEYGSAGKLKSVMLLSRKDYLLLGPSLHELAHNWANRILPAKMLDASGKEVNAKPHWGISDVGGQLGGFDRTTFKDNVGGDPKKYRGNMPGKKNFGFGSNGGNGQPYSNFELYLMGLIPKSEVKPIRFFTGVSAVRDEFIKDGTFTAEKMIQYTIEQIVGAPLNMGERQPAHDQSQKEFRILTIMLTPQPLTSKEWDDFDKQIKQFSFKGKDSSRLYNFWEATGGRASIKMNELHKAWKQQ